MAQINVMYLSSPYRTKAAPMATVSSTLLRIVPAQQRLRGDCKHCGLLVTLPGGPSSQSVIRQILLDPGWCLLTVSGTFFFIQPLRYFLIQIILIDQRFQIFIQQTSYEILLFSVKPLLLDFYYIPKVRKSKLRLDLITPPPGPLSLFQIHCDR